MIEMTTRSGQTVRVAESRVSAWEALGLTRVDQPAPKKAPAKKATAKRAAKKSASKK